ncbi:MAG: ribosome silencing factor [Planctomycetaceae bacterium]
MNNKETSEDAHELSQDQASKPDQSQSNPAAPPASMERFIRVGAANEGTEPGGAGGSDRGIPRARHVKDYSLQLATAAAKVALQNNGGDVLVLDVCDQTALFDYFVIATGTSRRQLHAISEEIDDVLQKQLGDRRLGIEGYEDSRWIVLDYGSVVIHLFDEETRSYYDLESLWADAKVIPLAELGLSDLDRGRKSDPDQ